MIRRLLTLAFVLAVAANSIGAVAPIVEDNGGCSICCNAARRNQPRLSPSKLCCLTECTQPGEAQPATTGSLQRADRNNKSTSAIVAGMATGYAKQSSGLLPSSARIIFQATPIYLTIGTLLI